MEKVQDCAELFAEEEERNRARVAQEDASGLTARRDAEIRAKMEAENLRYSKAENVSQEEEEEEEEEEED